jgi:hypothetical protein
MISVPTFYGGNFKNGTHEGTLGKLVYLPLLLHNLPDSVPFHNASSTEYNFSISEDNVADFGDKNSAFNHTLEISFGDRF